MMTSAKVVEIPVTSTDTFHSGKSSLGRSEYTLSCDKVIDNTQFCEIKKDRLNIFFADLFSTAYDDIYF